jgi:uncharacterized protein involved in response to NO
LLRWVLAPASPATAAGALIAAALQFARLLGWQGYLALREPLVAVLHAAYLFIPLGFAAIAAAALEWLSPAAAIHVLTVGAIGTMTLAIMTRATLGHTGHRLVASPWTVVAYAALLAAAVTRPLAGIVPEYSEALYAIAGAGWIAAFGIFVIVYGPMLVKPRAGQ